MPNDGFYIELKVRPDDALGCVYVSSDDVPGLHLIGGCLKDMKPMVEDAIKYLYRDNNNVNVNVIWLSDAKDVLHTEAPQRLAVYEMAA